ncbi:MAG: gamma-glutamyltransferase [Acidobacteria bacterium]|nr:gamma-glutamyltransferase [Acidobacteriota bacterium]MBV9070637.1 gamma-glutamyltransferase [Acidobacteriota bacterium]MBV9478176.1 gamma-glutamyltransferase [Acidobacteriota bacterium]
MRPRAIALLLVSAAIAVPSFAQRTQKPPLHGAHWMAITGKPLSATAGAMMFQKGGNAVDAAAAMLAAVCTQWDTLSWGGETQALIYNPHTKKVIGIDALGVAPTGATAQYYLSKGLKVPPEYGPLAALTPGTPGGLMTMLAEYGTLSLKDVLAPAIQMADGFPIEAQLASTIEKNKSWLKQWPYSRTTMLTHLRDANASASASATTASTQSSVTPAHDVVGGAASSPASTREAPEPGEMFHQPELAATLRKLVDAEQQALKRGKSRKEAIYAAYDRFYKGDIAQELARGTQEQGGLITTDDLARWQVKIEEPVMTNYRGVDVYKLTVWTQGPSMLQALNILENFDLKSMGYNSARYIHTLYQALNLAYADRDFYYGDPYFPPAEPVRGLLSKDYARERAKLVNPERNDPNIGPGDPYPYQNEKNPFLDTLRDWNATAAKPVASFERFHEQFLAGTTSIEAADEEGWVVSVTPSGGWVPAVIAGHTGVGLSQRAQSFDTDPKQNPFNVIEPGKRPHVTLTPTLAMKNGAPFLAFAVQGGDTQDQNLLQFFLDVVEFGMTPQEATEAANFNTFQVRKWLGDRQSVPGRILLNDQTPPWVRGELQKMGYTLTFEDRTSGPINAIEFDQKHGTMWGGSSNHGEDYGIGW